MTDNTELKRLAELLHGAEWQLVDGDGFDADNRFVTSQCRIDDNKVAFAEINYGHPEAGMGEPFQSEQVAAGEFIAAANPAAVLALIAENERMRAIHSVGPVKVAFDVMDERDQLRAEVAGLKTGYQAYERVNAELKAEVVSLKDEISIDDKIIAERDRLLNLFECPDHGQCVPYAMEQVAALRKDAERYRWLKSRPVNAPTSGPDLAQWDDHQGDALRGLFADEAIDAAMGHGEKS